MTVSEDIFVTTRILAFERYRIICRKQMKTEIFQQFHADLVEMASRVDCGKWENELVRDMLTAHMNNEKNAEEILAATRSPQDAYEYAIRLEKGIENNRTMKTKTFRWQITTKQEPIHYIITRGRNNYANSQNSKRGRDGFPSRPYTRGTQNTRRQQSRTMNLNTQKQCYKCGKQFFSKPFTVMSSKGWNLLKMHRVGPLCQNMSICKR